MSAPDTNFLIINIIINSLTLLGYIYLTSRQFLDLQRFKDNITPYRRIIFTIYLLAILTIVPVLTYQFLQLQGISSQLLLNISTVISPLNRAATVGLLILLVHRSFKPKKGDK